MAKKKTSTKKANTRPPIVTIMGHVDHGKTTLLDAIRESHLVDKEHGGITQHIGAYQVIHQSQKITFIDTPGHAAFSKMRRRGADVTDIVVLVVAANDGVKPQTVESIKHIKAADVPVVVAINKTDVEGSSPDMVKSQLTEHEVFCEGYGGQTPAVELSAIKKTGIKDLLEMILLVAEMQELKLDPKSPLEAVVIESKLDKQKGPMASVIVKSGSLKLGDKVYIDQKEHKIRAMFDDPGNRVSLAKPGDPVAIMGLKSVPVVGSVMTQDPVSPQPTKETSKTPNQIEEEGKSDSDDKKSTKPKKSKKDKNDKNKDEEGVDNDDQDQNQNNEEPEEERPAFNLVLKADTAGTLEAIIQSAIHDEVTLVHSGVGPVSESDVLLAQSTNSLIIGFNTRVTAAAAKLAKLEKVTIKEFNIIYKLIEFLEEKILTLIEPTINEEELGVAEIKATFDIRGESIAGCKVLSGTIEKKHPIHLVRDDKIIKDAKIKSLKRGKDDIAKVKSGGECGIVFKNQLDFKEGDRIKSYRTIED